MGACLLVGFLLGAPELSVAARVEAQRTIERARYVFVIGATQPFDTLYPRSVFERRVARQSEEERVLQQQFGMTVTPALLAQEYERVEKTTRAEDQWAAIKTALSNDRRLIEEAICRPLLVERALRARFDLDQKIHAEPHQKARLARVSFLAKQPVPGSAIRLVRRRSEAAASADEMLGTAKAEASGPRVLRPPSEPDKDAPLPLGPELAAVLEKELKSPGDVTTILEDREQFRVFRLLDATADEWRVEVVAFPKIGFDSWFEGVRKIAGG